MTKSPKESIKIGCACAFWGDTQSATQQLLQNAKLDYLVFDYLSEVTLGLLAKNKSKNPQAGFIPDFIEVMQKNLPEIKQQGVKVISNAGGLNPKTCVAALTELCKQQNIALNIAYIEGDDCLSQPSLQADYQQTIATNCYLGAPSISMAFELGADIVITGRIVDSALTLAPCLYEFNWEKTDYNKLAQASLAGHLIECGPQVSGGNFTDWHEVEGFDNMGFPIVECFANGHFILTKAENTGGLITRETILEQMLYEVADPREYQLPDVNCDFSDVTLTKQTSNQFLITGATGTKPYGFYKTLSCSLSGFQMVASFLLVGLQVGNKANTTTEALVKNVNRQLVEAKIRPVEHISIDILGEQKESVAGFQQVIVRLAAEHENPKALKIFSREIAQVATSMAPGLVSLLGGRPSVVPKITLNASFIPKSNLPISITLNDKKETFIDKADCRTIEKSITNIETTFNPVSLNGATQSIPLHKLAVARSGDKGNNANIGLIARHPKWYNLIAQQITTEFVKSVFQKVCKGKVDAYALPKQTAINFVLHNTLGGGGLSFSHTDPQAKGYAQRLLAEEILVPKSMLKDVELS